MTFTYLDISKAIDHALLAPTLRDTELESGCLLALRYDVASVCILPFALKRCSEMLSGSTVRASTTIGFPHGAHTTAVKQAEAEQALRDGCEELDVVANISKVLTGDWAYVEKDLAAVISPAHSAGRKVKVIFETCYLDESQKIRLCELCGDLNTDWVKTSTGFGPAGATVEDVRLMRRHSPERVQVKASGGIRDLERVLNLRVAGATRIGISRTKEILDACRVQLGLAPLGEP